MPIGSSRPHRSGQRALVTAGSPRLPGLLARSARAQKGRAVVIGCNCGGNKNKSLKYLYTSPKGEHKVYTTEIEARAAQIRNGGGNITVQAA